MEDLRLALGEDISDMRLSVTINTGYSNYILAELDKKKEIDRASWAYFHNEKLLARSGMEIFSTTFFFSRALIAEERLRGASFVLGREDLVGGGCYTLLYHEGGKKRPRRFVVLLYSHIETVFYPSQKPSTPIFMMESHPKTHFDSHARKITGPSHQRWLPEMEYGLIVLIMFFATGGIYSNKARVTPANAIRQGSRSPSSGLLQLDSCRAQSFSYFIKLFHTRLMTTLLDPLFPAHGIITQEVIHDAVEI